MTVWCISTWLSTLPRVVRGWVARRLDRLRDGDAEAPRLSGLSARILRPARSDQKGWGGPWPPRFPSSPSGMASGRTSAHLPYLATQSEDAAGESEGAAPLPGTRLGGDPLDPSSAL